MPNTQKQTPETAAVQVKPETPAQSSEAEAVEELNPAQQAEIIADAMDAANAEPPRPKIEKTLANCKPREFMRQTYRVKKFAEKWLTDTDIMNIRKNVPQVPKINPNDPPEKREAQRKANKETMEKAGLENVSRMFDAIFGEHPDETLELLALCCFVEPEHIDDYMIADYLSALAGMLVSDTVTTFFTSFMSLARMITGGTLKA